MYKCISKRLNDIANDNNMNFYGFWGTEGGSNWIWSKQDDEKKFRVQIFTLENYDKYNEIKNSVVSLFQEFECTIYKDEDVGNTSFGVRRDLYFMDKSDYEKIELKELEEKALVNNQYNIGAINANGSNLAFGNATNSNQTIELDSNSDEKKGSIFQKLGNHFTRYKWFYGGIITVIVAVVLKLLGIK